MSDLKAVIKSGFTTLQAKAILGKGSDGVLVSSKPGQVIPAGNAVRGDFPVPIALSNDRFCHISEDDPSQLVIEHTGFYVISVASSSVDAYAGLAIPGVLGGVGGIVQAGTVGLLEGGTNDDLESVLPAQVWSTLYLVAPLDVSFT